MTTGLVWVLLIAYIGPSGTPGLAVYQTPEATTRHFNSDEACEAAKPHAEKLALEIGLKYHSSICHLEGMGV